MIDRRLFSNVLDLLTYFPVVGIVGPRQVGKTTLAKALAPQIEHEVVYLDLEYPEDVSKLSDPVLYLEKNQHACIVIDEVQRMPELFPVLRSIIDQDRRAARFILLGSASPELIRDSSESLAGRIAYVELTPFNLLEIKDQFSMDHHWFWGGYPDAILAPNHKLSRIWLKQFVQSYVERDLPALGFGGSSKMANRFWQMLAHFNGNLMNASTFAKSLGISVPTVTRYLDFFEDAFLIRRLQPWATNTKKRLVKAPKIYLRDTGILHYIAGIADIDKLAGHILIGSSWENYVIEQIYQILTEDHQLYFYRTQAGAEVDLVIVQGLHPVACIEIKYTSSPKVTRGMQQVIADLNTVRNYIITPNTETYHINNEVKVCNLMDFLVNEVSVF
jgi:predicted AAA+ superfamily ATPase